MSGNIKITIQMVDEAADFIKSKINISPKIAIMCSTEMDTLTDILGIKRQLVVPYSNIPHFPKIRARRSNQLIFGNMYKRPILILQGMLHLYEGYTLQQSTLLIYVLKAVGVEYLLLGNTAGAVNPDYKIGDVLLIRKHLYSMGHYDLNPVDEPSNEKNGPRFVNRTLVYDKKLINKSKEILAKDLEFNDGVHVGTYAFVSGPSYETVAEVKLLKSNKVDAVGMCIVPEVLAAKRCGLTVFAFSLITNVCVDDYDIDEETSHDDVLQISNERSAILKVFLEKLIDYSNYLIAEKHDDNYGRKISNTMKVQSKQYFV